MSPDYIMVSLTDTNGKKRNVIKRLWSRYITKSPNYTKYTIQNQGAITGVHAVLPIEEADLSNLSKDELRRYILYIKERMESQYVPILLEPRLREVLEVGAYKTPFFLLFVVEELVERIGINRGIEQKNLKVMILDDGTWRTEYVLWQLAARLNHICIVSQEKTKWARILQQLLDEYGIIIPVYQMPLTETVQADIVLNLSENPGKFYQHIEGNFSVFDFCPGKRRKQFIRTYAKETIYYSNVILRSLTSQVDTEVVSELLFHKHIEFRKFCHGEINEISYEGVEQMLREYCIEFHGLI